MERDYSRLRDVEMRYRLLFQLSSEAVLILEAARLRVTEANPAARSMFGVEVGELAGLGPSQMFDEESAQRVQAHLDAVRAGVRADDVQARTAPRPSQGRRDVLVRASVFRQDGETLFLMRITAVHDDAVAAPVPDVKAKLLRAVESAPGRVRRHRRCRPGDHRQRRLPRDGAARRTRTRRAAARSTIGWARPVST